MLEQLQNIFEMLSTVERTGLAVYAVLAVAALIVRRMQGLRWLLISQAILWSYLSQRLIFLNRFALPWHWLMLAGGVLMCLYALFEQEPEDQPSPPPRWVEITLVSVIIIAGFVFRAHMFTTLPPGCYYDEAEIGKDYLYKIQQPGFSWKTIYDDHVERGVPITYWYPAGYFGLVLGKACTSVRLPAVISGMITLPLFYGLLRIMFGWRIAMLGLLTMTASIWHIISSRTGFSCVQTPMFTAMALFVFFVGWKRQRWSSLWYGLGVLPLGIAALWGLGRVLDPWGGFATVESSLSFAVFAAIILVLIYVGVRMDGLWYPLFLLIYFFGQTSYHPSRTIIAYPLLFLGHRLVAYVLPRFWRYFRESMPMWGKIATVTSTLAVVVGLGAASTIAYQRVAAIEPKDLRSTIQNTFGVQDIVMDLMERRLIFLQIPDGRYFYHWWNHTQRYLHQFHLAGDGNPRHNVPKRPGVNFFTGIFLIPGLAYSIFRWRWKYYFTFICIGVIMFIPALISQDSPHFLRSIGVITAMYAFVGIGMGKLWKETARTFWPESDETAEAVADANEGRQPRPVRRYLGLGSARLAQVTGLVLITGFWMASYAENYEAIFEEYPEHHLTWDYFDSWWYEMGHFVNGLENTIEGRYKVILLKEFTGNIPALQYPVKDPKVLERLDYGKHIPIKDPGDIHTFVYIFNHSYPAETARLREYYPNALFQEIKNRFGQYMFTAIFVTQRDIIESQGLHMRQTWQGKLVSEQRVNEINYEDGLQLTEYPVPDQISWSGLLNIQRYDSYTFTVETDSPVRIELNDLEVLRVGRAQLREGEPVRFEFSLTLGVGQFPIRITLEHSEASRRFRWLWKRASEPGEAAVVPRIALFNGDVVDQELMGVMYRDRPLELKLEKMWTVESEETPLAANREQFVTMTQDERGNIYAMKGTRVFVFDADGNYIREFGERGHLDGQWKHPESIAHNYNGLLYVNDFWQGGLQKFTEEGQFVMRFTNKQMNQVDAMPDGTVYAANRHEISIIRDEQLGFVRRFARQEGYEHVIQPRFPMGVVTNKRDRLYVSDRELERMWQFDLNGSMLRTWPLYGQDYKSQMTVDTHGRVYVTTFLNRDQTIAIFDEQGYGVTPVFLRENGRPFEIDLPIPILGGQGNVLYIGSASQHRIFKFRYDPPGPGGLPAAIPRPGAPAQDQAAPPPTATPPDTTQ